MSRRPSSDTPFGMDAPAPSDAVEQRAALRHLGLVVSVLGACCALTYAVPQTSSLRPWLPGEGVPVARLFGRAQGEAVVAVTGGASSGVPGTSPVDPALFAALEEAPPPTPPAGEGSATVEPAQRAVRVDPSELEGLTQEIEDPAGTAMRAFYEQLLRTARAEPGAVTRVSHFGDSSIALDGITDTVRRDLQRRFGDAGHGFILAAKGSLPYRHHDVQHGSSDEGWHLLDITRGPLSEGHYGLGGYQVRSSSGASAWFATAEDADAPVGRAVSRFVVFYERHAHGGRVELRVDGGEPSVLDTRGDSTSDELHVVEVPDGAHRLDLRTVGHGESHLYGVAMERPGPGVVYDSLGMVGARASRFLNFDPEHLSRQLALRGTSLIVIGYGGNDADDARPEAQFEADFRRVAHLARQARPQASCLLFAPIDQAERDERGRIRTMSTVPSIVAAARRAALAEGCAFFDTWSAMGGEGSMERWFRAQPRLAFGDFRHATPAGYRVVGHLFYKALLRGFAAHLARP